MCFGRTNKQKRVKKSVLCIRGKTSLCSRFKKGIEMNGSASPQRMFWRRKSEQQRQKTKTVESKSDAADCCDQQQNAYCIHLLLFIFGRKRLAYASTKTNSRRAKKEEKRKNATKKKPNPPRSFNHCQIRTYLNHQKLEARLGCCAWCQSAEAPSFVSAPLPWSPHETTHHQAPGACFRQ